MSAIIDDLVRKLESANRVAARIQKEHDDARAEVAGLLKALEQALGKVNELESAISILRNNLKPKAAPSGDDKVTTLRPK